MTAMVQQDKMQDKISRSVALKEQQLKEVAEKFRRMNNIKNSMKKKFKRAKDQEDIVVVEEGDRIITSEEQQDEDR